MAKDIDEDNQH